MAGNSLYYGDNLDMLRHRIEKESVDLVYLDPPFNSNADYRAIFRARSSGKSVTQIKHIKAFTDTWHWDKHATERAFENILTHAPNSVAKMLEAMVSFVGRNDVTAYLVMMTQRLVELHRVLKPTGSLYLHCDPSASHYLKIVLDTIFGPANFHNEVVWKRSSAHSDVVQGAKHYGRIHDTVLFYSKSKVRTWNTAYLPYERDYVENIYRSVEPDGRRYQTQPLHAAKPGGDTLYEWKGAFPPTGRYWAFSRENMEKLDAEGRIVYSRNGVPRYKIYLDESKGVPAQDVWTDLTPAHQLPKEHLGYPTQKPLALLERIISVSSNPGDVVLDPFCGGGTAICAAQKLERQWIGIDRTHLAISLVKSRLKSMFGLDPNSDYEVLGEPANEDEE